MSKEKKWTDGEWSFRWTAFSEEDIAFMKAAGKEAPRVLGNNGEVYITAGDKRIATVDSVIDRTRKTPYDAPDEERDANARLIAAAWDAPKVIEDLLTLVEHMSAYVGQMALPDYALLNDAPIAAQRFLAKARGEEPTS